MLQHEERVRDTFADRARHSYRLIEREIEIELDRDTHTHIWLATMG